jgi:hypothetical protein
MDFVRSYNRDNPGSTDVFAATALVISSSLRFSSFRPIGRAACEGALGGGDAEVSKLSPRKGYLHGPTSGSKRTE